MKRLTLFILLASLQVQASVCPVYEPPEAYNKMKSSIEKRIELFANSKLIAVEADATLSKLIMAKSPVIFSWLDRTQISTKSEVEIAKAWRLYYAKNIVLAKYPQDDKRINREIETLVNNALAENLTNNFKARIEKIFKKTQTQSIATLKDLLPAKYADAVSRVEKIKLYWPVKLETARNSAIPLDLIAWGVAYDPVANEINMGTESLYYSNDETYMAVFAHEIGHSFDSCRWGAFFKGSWPFEKVGECLRSGKSVGAKKRDDSKLSSVKNLDLIEALKANPTCNKLVYPPLGIQADQLPEAFADWFSAEVISRISDLKTDKLRTDLCDQKKLVEGTSYPTGEERRQKIYFAHPKIKASTSESYCPLK